MTDFPKITNLMLMLLLASTLAFAQSSDSSKTNSDTDFKNKSIEELAKDLANPNTPLTSLKFKTQFRAWG